MGLYKLIVPFGIFTYLMVWIQILTGTRVIKVNFKWHKRFGFIAIISASLHASLVIYTTYF